MSDSRPLGPNAKKLLAELIAKHSVPAGGGLADGMRFFADAEHRRAVLDRAMTDLDAVIQAVRSAPDNPHGADEEKIAAAILSRLQSVKKERGYR